MKHLYALVCIMPWLTPAAARPCATCATISNPSIQDLARARASSSPARASCATMRDPNLAALCRSGGLR